MSIHINKKRKQYFICYKVYDSEKEKYITHTITNSTWTLDKGIKYIRSIEESIIAEDKRKKKLHTKKGNESMFAELIDLYKDDLKLQYKPQTYYSKIHSISKYVEPSFQMDKMLNDTLTQANMNKFKANIIKANISPKWANKILLIMRNIIKFASDRDMISFDLERKLSLCLKNFKETAMPDEKLKFWTTEEYNAFIASFDDNDRFKMLFRTTYECALRLGEVLALKWEDFNFEKKTLSINKSQDNQGNITTPKNASSNALVSLSTDLAKSLKQYQKDTAGNVNDYIFFADHHTSRTTIRYKMNEHIELAKVPFINFHGLRHSCASRLINLGCSPLIVSKHLRHSSTQQTLDTYAHLFPTATEGLMDKVF